MISGNPVLMGCGPGNGRRESCGFTLLEVSIAAGLVILLFGTVAMVYPSLTEATVETQMFLSAQMENDRARLALTEDLQSTNSTENDAAGVPYFKIENHGTGTANSIVFRRAEGFDVDLAADLVTTRYGTPITYSVDGSGNLIRSQGGQDRVVARQVQGILFSSTLEGTVTVQITTVYGREGKRQNIASAVEVTPRNVLRM
jgi:hypothetical protein